MRILRSELRLRLSPWCLAVASILIASCGLALDSQAKVERGEQALADGDYRAAIIDAKSVLQKEPDNLEARLLLGRASVSVGDGAAAEKELRRALELGAGMPDVLVDLGRSMLQQGKFDGVLAEISIDAASDADRVDVMRIRAEATLGLDRPAEARALFNEALSIDASDVASQLGIARTYIAERNYIQARENLINILDNDPEHVPSLLASGALGIQLRDLTRAESDFTLAADLAKADSDIATELQALSGLIEAVLLGQRPDDARPPVKRMQEIAPDHLQTQMATARLLIADEEWTAAQEILQQVLRRAPEYRNAQLLLGVVHKQSGNLGQAEMYLSAVVAATPLDSRARRLLAETRLALNDVEAARQVLNPIVEGTDADVVSLSMAAGASLSLGDIDEAVEFLERGVARDPDNVDLQIQLAFAYYRDAQLGKARQVLESLPDMSGRRGEFRRDSLLVLTGLANGDEDDALQAARELRRKWPDQVTAHRLVGSVEMALGDYDSARGSFQRGLEVMPDDVELIRYLARLDLLEDDREAAAQRYRLILELQPNDSTTMLSLARLAAQAEDHGNAREWLQKARRADPKSVSARAVLTSHFLAFREFAAAEEVAKEAVALNPAHPRLQNYLGLSQLYQEKYRDAAIAFGKAVELVPDEASYAVNLARAQSAQSNHSTALITLQNLGDEGLKYLPAGVLMATLEARLGNMSGAKTVARRLAELHPDSAAPRALTAELFAREGQMAEAAKTYDAALAMATIDRYAIRAYEIRRQGGLTDPLGPLLRYLEKRPLDARVRFYLGSAYEGTGEPDLAIAQYEQILEHEPDNYLAANNLAWNYLLRGDDRAEPLARKAYGLSPENGSVIDTLGWILVEKNELDEGIGLLRKAVMHTDNNPEVRYHLAAALARSGAQGEARAILEELLRSVESFSSRRDAESLLESL